MLLNPFEAHEKLKYVLYKNIGCQKKFIESIFFFFFFFFFFLELKIKKKKQKNNF